MKTKFLFDHIYKAAGTSLERVFVERYGQANVTFGLNEPLDLALRRHANKTVITGHFSIMPGQRLPADRYALTLLRHPVDRALSHYYFCRNHVPRRGGNAAVELSKTLSLEEYVYSDAPEVSTLLRDDQTNHFLPLGWDGSSELTADQKFEAAKAALEQYDLVGGFEEFEDFVHVLTIDAAIPPVRDIPKLNVTNGRVDFAAVAPEVRRRLEELNQLDLALYECALRLFRIKRREVLRACAIRRVGLREGLEEIQEAEATTEVQGRMCSAPSGGLAPGVTQAQAGIEFGSRRVVFLSAAVCGNVSRNHSVFAGEMVTVSLFIRAHEPINDVVVGIRIVDESSRIVFGSNCRAQGRTLEIRRPGDYLVEFRFRCDLGYGDYAISAALHQATRGFAEYYHWRDQIAWLSVVGNIGDHWEGTAKLYPQVLCSAIDPDLVGQIALSDAGAGWEGSLHLSDHSPLLTEFRGDVEPLGEIEALRVCEVRAIEMAVRNDGLQTWPSTGLQRVCVSYHWLDRAGNMLVYDGERTPLPRDFGPGEQMKVWVVVKAPPAPGDCTLVLTLVQDYHAWFDEMGANPIVREIQIIAGAARGEAGTDDADRESIPMFEESKDG